MTRNRVISRDLRFVFEISSVVGGSSGLLESVFIDFYLRIHKTGAANAAPVCFATYYTSVLVVVLSEEFMLFITTSMHISNQIENLFFGQLIEQALGHNGKLRCDPVIDVVFVDD